MGYKRIIRVEANENESEQLLARVENARKIIAIKTKKADVSDKDLVLYFLDMLESQQAEKGLTRADKNAEKIQELITQQMAVNATDNEAVPLNGKLIYVNKRRITSSFVQLTLGCSFNPVKAWFDNEANQAMLDKHHAKYGINESYNRLVSKALKQASKE
jgi:hypothetical protein